MQFFKILIPRVGLNPFDYTSPKSCRATYSIGDIVRVPLRNKITLGIIWDQISESDLSSQQKSKLKEIIPDDTSKESDDTSKESGDVLEGILYQENNIGKGNLKLIELASRYYLTELGSIAKLILPVDIYEKPIKSLKQDISSFPDSQDYSKKDTNYTEFYNLKKLNADQDAALETILGADIPVLLNGVTGSGKTEIYFHLVAKMLSQGKQCLIMLPEIGILKQIAKRFEDAFGFAPAIWNSSVTKAKKKPIMRGIINGDVRLVIGTRSSLFLPYKNLGAIIVDEEHDPSYKQSENIRYNARDMAVLKGKIGNSKVVLLSATPSIESIHNTTQGKYKLIKISSRFNEASLPDVEIIDMRKEELPPNRWISKKLSNSIKQNLESAKQSMIFLNRRGYAPLTLCRDCGYRFECNNCSSFLVVHKKSANMQCHHCGQTKKICLDCPECSSDNIAFSGPGIERIEEELRSLFPKARISLLSRNHQDNEGDEINDTLVDMQEGKVDILIGTQIITKGYHFPKLTVVGVIDADMGLSGSDFRASERSFQLLHQVGGRAGREDLKGIVYMQTYNPESNVIKALSSNDMDNFLDYELKSRQELLMPPFGKMVAIYFSGKNESFIKDKMLEFARKAPRSEARILGPVPANLYRLSGSYRFQIVVMSSREFNIQKYVEYWLASMKIPASIRVKIDIDPQAFL